MHEVIDDLTKALIGVRDPGEIRKQVAMHFLAYFLAVEAEALTKIQELQNENASLRDLVNKEPKSRGSVH